MKKHVLLAAIAAFAMAVAAPMGASPAQANGYPCQVKKAKKKMCAVPRAAPAAPVVKYIVAPPQVPTMAVPGPGPAPMVFVYGDPFAMQMANDGCPMVNDALLLENLPDGQTRYRWRGTDWAYLPPKPEPSSRICTRNGRLAWWSPPKPRVLTPGVPVDQQTPTPAPQAAPGSQQGAAPRASEPVFYSMTR